MREWLAAVVIAALVGSALRARRTRPSDDDYEDYSTDSYTLELATPEGPIEFKSRLPFIGTEWGQYRRLDEDDD